MRWGRISKAQKKEQAERRRWAYYIVFPCVFFYATITRLPLIFAACFVVDGLNLPAYMGVLAVAIYSMGRAFGATVLSKKENMLRNTTISAGSSVLSFFAIMLIPWFPNANCNNLGLQCFDDEAFSEKKFPLTMVVRTCNITAYTGSP